MADKNPFAAEAAATRVGARNNVIDRTVEEIERGTPPRPPPPKPRSEADAGRARRVRTPAPKPAPEAPPSPKKGRKSVDMLDVIGYISRLGRAQSNPGNK